MKALIIVLLMAFASCHTIDTVKEAGTVGSFAAAGAVGAGPLGALVAGTLGVLVADNVRKDEAIDSLQEDKKEMFRAIVPEVITNTIKVPATYKDFLYKFWYILVLSALIGLITHPQKTYKWLRGLMKKK